MNIEMMKNIAFFVVLCLAQALVLNNVRMFNCATPLLYIYMVLLFRRNYPRWGILLWSFALGLVVDIFSNTPGVASASMTVVGLVQPYILAPFIPRDSAEDFEPSMKNLGMGAFTLYTFIMVLLYCLLFFTFEMFNFFNFIFWIECVGGSTVLTLLTILVIENMHKK